MDTSATPATDPRTEHVLEVDSIVTRFGAEAIHDGVSFKVRRGEVVALIGSSGTGKSVLVIPRLAAITIALPLLVFVGDLAGILGGVLVGELQLDISAVTFFDRLHSVLPMSAPVVGLVKAPVFAFVIAIIGCMHGLRVRGSAESVGRETTRAVVKSIFLVIVLDALFSVLFEQVGL